MKENTRLFERIIRLAFPHLSKPQHKVFAQLITAFPKAAGFTLSDIASNFPGETEVKHKLKKLQYFLDGLTTDIDFWNSYIRLVLSLPNLKLSKREKISVTVNTGNLGHGFTLLTANISYRNKPLPIYLRLFAQLNNQLAPEKEAEAFLNILKLILPDKFTYLFIADSRDILFVNDLYSWSYDYIVRIRPKLLKLKDASDYTDIRLFPDGVYHDAVTDILPVCNNTNIATISLPGEAEGRSCIYFSTNLIKKEEVLDHYLRRIVFEEDQESLINELNWLKFSKKPPLKPRLEKLLIISCLSYALNSPSNNEMIKYLQHIIVNLTRK